jgi:hypothetical protein
MSSTSKLPEVEFFSDEVNGIEYLNVGLRWYVNGKEVRAVLGAFQGDVAQEAMVIIKGLVEQAVIYVLGLDADVGGGANVNG